MSTNGGKALLDQIEIVYGDMGDCITVYVDVYDNSLSRKWLSALNVLLKNNYHLEKNYCFLGFPDSKRNGAYIVDQINKSINAINNANLGYVIHDNFTIENSITPGVILPEHTYPIGQRPEKFPGEVNHEHFNMLHRYFEDLQGVSGHMSEYYNNADDETRWHIRQLNLLCHEFESWAISNRKKYTAPEWVRCSQLMCWINAPRFFLTEEDYELFGIETMNRPLGGVYVGVNKAVGKHHWEVFVDEARYNSNMIVANLTTTTMRSQLEAAGDFDIEWSNDPGSYAWQKKHLSDFRQWLINNNFNPDDKSLTIGHPQVGQVDLLRSFGSTDYKHIWSLLSSRLNVSSIKTNEVSVSYDFNWDDSDFISRQIHHLGMSRA
jgi:hypothetical protein